MKIIAHRKNTIDELRSTPHAYGVEVDLRSRGDALILQHDAFKPGESFDAWIKEYRHGTLILNVKEEGLEERILDIMKAHGIEDFFFLDQSFPFLVRTARKGETRCAVRVSEYESCRTALTLAGLVDWVWVDCFTRFPIGHAEAAELKAAGFKLCLVSPELQGRDAGPAIAGMRDELSRLDIQPDAVCTKRADLWTEALR